MVLENFKKNLLHIMLSNQCTQCGKKQDVGDIFYDYGNKYLCEECDLIEEEK